MSSELFVHLDGVLTGVYSQTKAGATTFTYDEAYRRRGDATPLSMSLPLEASAHSSKAVNGYFAGLIPEGDKALQQINDKYGLRGKPHPFKILRHIGRDAPGAVQVLPPDEESDDGATKRGNVTELSDDDFVELITELAESPDDWEMRANPGKWSLPGAQRKVALFRFPNGRWGIPNDSTPTTHILKPAITGFANHDVNEFLSMRAAKWFGMPSAPTDVLKVTPDLSVLMSTRYDRREVNGQWRRLHQEDFCQALSVLPEYKYQDKGGPGVAHIADLITQFANTTDRDESRIRFFDALVFNVAAWATDAHAKNYSILLAGGRQTLAPLYDIATHAPYPPGDKPDASAMKIGDEYALGRIGKAHLLKAAARVRLDREFASARIDEICQNVSNAYAEAAREIAGDRLLAAAARRVVDSIHRKSKERGWVDMASHIDLAPPATPQGRVGRGQSAGGEFTARQRAESAVTLKAETI